MATTTDGGAVEASFSVSDRQVPFVGLSADPGCRVELRRLFPRGDGELAELFEVTGVDGGRFVERAREYGFEEVALLADEGKRALVEFVVSNCPVEALTGAGAIPTTVAAADGDGTVVVQIPERHDATEVLASFHERHPTFDLRAKRSIPRVAPVDGWSAGGDAEQLTDRQLSVLRTAFRSGYYEIPREAHGRDIAEAIGISTSTLRRHLREVERTLVSGLLGD